MRVATGIPGRLEDVADGVRRAEDLGYDVLTADETAHEPFLRLALAAEHSRSAELTSAVAIAFARSPFVTAQQAWAIQRLSGGRFVLGLGTQVKAHIERRFAQPWGPPGPRLREYIECLRAVWRTWQTGERPAYQGTHFQFTLMNPGSSPGPIEHPEIPVMVAAVNPFNARLGGQVADGAAFHPFSTFRYLREILVPALVEGARRAGKDPAGLRVRSGAFIATGRDDEEVDRAREQARRRISYYGSTPAYRAVMELHGWDAVQRQLLVLSKEGRWDDMTPLISDAMLDEFCLAATWDELPATVARTHAGLATELSFPATPRDPDDAAHIREVIAALQRVPGTIAG